MRLRRRIVVCSCLKERLLYWSGHVICASMVCSRISHVSNTTVVAHILVSRDIYNRLESSQLLSIDVVAQMAASPKKQYFSSLTILRIEGEQSRVCSSFKD